MPRFLISLITFGGYTLALLLIAQTFEWNETRKTFYLGGRRTGFCMSLATFCATWLSAASLAGFTLWMMTDGYTAFYGSVLGWMLGLLPMPLLIYRFRSLRAISIPEWMARQYGDDRLRWLCGGAMLISYSFYLVIQFRAFGEIASHMLQIPRGFHATALIYLFVLHTTFGGYPSVVRSDTLNLLLAVVGVTLAAVAAVSVYGGPVEAHFKLAREAPGLLRSGWRQGEIATTASLALAWGLGVMANPQYAVRVMAARTARDAAKMLCAAPLVLGWVYFCLTCLSTVCRAFAGFPDGGQVEFSAFFEGALPMWGALPLFIAVLAAAVSTANSHLLLAACSLCNDILSSKRGEPTLIGEDRFLFFNRLAIVGIASLSLLISQIPLPGILAIGRICWTVMAICFLFPFYFPVGVTKMGGTRRGIFPVTLFSLGMHVFLALLTPVTWELSMLLILGVQSLFWFGVRMGERRAGA